MSDYLGNLVERSFAPILAVRPNTPSQFESSPVTSPVNGPSEVDLPVDSKITASTQRSPVSTQRSPASAENNSARTPKAAREKNHHAQGEFSEHPLIEPPETISAETSAPFSPFAKTPSPPQNFSPTPTPRHADAAVRSVASPPRTIRPVDPATTSTEVLNAQSHFSPEIRPSAASTKGTFPRDSSRPVSPVARKENGPSPSRETSAPPSTIHVTIGRVEIKATTPPTTASRANPRKNPAMSLDHYLQRRSNGGRDE